MSIHGSSSKQLTMGINAPSFYIVQSSASSVGVPAPLVLQKGTSLGSDPFVMTARRRQILSRSSCTYLPSQGAAVFKCPSKRKHALCKDISTTPKNATKKLFHPPPRGFLGILQHLPDFLYHFSGQPFSRAHWRTS